MFCADLEDLIRCRPRADDLGMERAALLASATKATDPRDRIYSLLALINREEREAIQVDYTKPWRRVFMEVTATLLICHRDLRMLELVTGSRYRSRMKSLPCWTVDFTFAESSEDGESLGTISRLSFDRHWHKKDHGKIMFHLDLPKGALHAKCIYFDQIDTRILRRQHKHQRAYPHPDFYGYVNNISRIFDSLGSRTPFDNLNHQFGSYNATNRRDISSYYSDPNYSSERIAWHQAKQSFLSRDWPQLMGPPPVPNDVYDTRTAMKVLTQAWETWSLAVNEQSEQYDQRSLQSANHETFRWLKYCDFFAGNTLLFGTSSGFIGLAPESAAFGDRIVLPLGHHTPMLLRAKGDGAYSFQGFVFVHGIMDGEIPRRVPAMLDHVNEFVIA